MYVLVNVLLPVKIIHIMEFFAFIRNLLKWHNLTQNSLHMDNKEEKPGSLFTSLVLPCCCPSPRRHFWYITLNVVYASLFIWFLNINKWTPSPLKIITMHRSLDCKSYL